MSERTGRRKGRTPRHGWRRRSASRALATGGDRTWARWCRYGAAGLAILLVVAGPLAPPPRPTAVGGPLTAALSSPPMRAVEVTNAVSAASLGAEGTGPAEMLRPQWHRPAPSVVSATPTGTLPAIDAGVEIVFSQPMMRRAVEGSFRIQPSVDVTSQWVDDRTIVFRPAALAYHTTYAVEVGGSSQDGRAAPATAWTFTTPVSAPRTASPYVLTFDDCGMPQQVRAILAALAVRHLTAVFFPTGVCRNAYPWLVPTLLALGHRVCNHTYSHPFLTRLSDAAIRAEIADGVHAGCDLFRPPYGVWDGPHGRIAAIAASLGYRVQMWDVDTRDWAGTSAAEMVAMIHAHGGGVVLMHMHGRHTAEAILTL